MPMMPQRGNMGFDTARTTYGGGGATTRATGRAFEGPNSDFLDFFKMLARRRMQPQAPPQQYMGSAPRQAPMPQQQERPGPNVKGTPAGPNDQAQRGSYKTIGGQTFLMPDPYGDVVMGYGPPVQVPQNASFQGGYGPGATSTPGLNTGYGVGTPTDVSGNPVGGGSGGGGGGGSAIEDWRRQAFISQNPYSSGLMDRFQIDSGA